MIKDGYVTTGQAAKDVGVHTTTLLQWIVEGKIPECPKSETNRNRWYPDNIEAAKEYKKVRVKEMKKTPAEKVEGGEYLTTEKLANLAGVDRSTILRWIKQGKIADCEKKGNRRFRYWNSEEAEAVKKYADLLTGLVKTR
jgi:excisionase family DNA binding protein